MRRKREISQINGRKKKTATGCSSFQFVRRVTHFQFSRRVWNIYNLVAGGCQIYFSSLSIISQWPALVLPSRIRIPFFCRSARSRQIVRGTTDKTSDILSPVMKVSLLINSSIFFCLSVSWTSDKLVTELVTLSATLSATLSTTLLPPCDIFMKLVRSMVTRTPPQKFSTLCFDSRYSLVALFFFIVLYICTHSACKVTKK